MHIVLGASGQIGSLLVDNLLAQGQPVRAVVRNREKAKAIKQKGAEPFIADYSDGQALTQAFKGGSTVFLLTPENPQCEDLINESQALIRNYREAIISSGARKIVALSSMGAQHESGTGNLIVSHRLEHAFADLNIEQIFIRPAYYYSNWLCYIELIKQHGILPTLFPPALEVSMVAPPDVAQFIADVMTSKKPQAKIYEVTGPAYSSLDIAKLFETVLGREVHVQQILPADWEKSLLQAGFSKDGAKNLSLMTKAVIDGKTNHETANLVICPTDFNQYLQNRI